MGLKHMHITLMWPRLR